MAVVRPPMSQQHDMSSSGDQRTEVAMDHTPAGEGWRVVFGACVAGVQLAIFAVAWYITTYHYDQAPFLIQNKFLARLQILGTATTLLVPVIDMTGEGWIPCPVLMIGCGLVGAATVTPLQLQMLYIVGLLSFEDQKTRLRVGKVKLTEVQVRSLQTAKDWYSTRRMRWRVAVAVITYSTIFVVIAFTDPYYRSGTGCRIQRAPGPNGRLDSCVLAWLIMLAIGVPLSIYITRRLVRLRQAKVADSLHLVRNNNVYIGLVSGTTPAMVAVIWLDYPSYMSVWTPFYIFTLSVTFVIVMHIIAPFVQTTHTYQRVSRWSRRVLFRRPVSPFEELVSLQSVLLDPLGVNYMLQFCKGELNEENVLILLWIAEYRQNPTVSTMLDIYDTFIHDDAPLMVNLPSTITKRIKLSVANVPAYATAIEIEHIFDQVEQTITQLLHNNSWRRFKESKLFAAYLEREALPTTIQHHTPTLVNDTLTQRTPKKHQMLAVHPALTATNTDTIANSRANLLLDVDLIHSNRSDPGGSRLLSVDTVAPTAHRKSYITPGGDTQVIAHQRHPSWGAHASPVIQNATRLHKLSCPASFDRPNQSAQSGRASVTHSSDNAILIASHRKGSITKTSSMRLPDPVLEVTDELRTRNADFMSAAQAAEKLAAEAEAHAVG